MGKLVPFSKKQSQILTWWHPNSPVSDYGGIIADGSIRAGKTFPMAISFIEWAFFFFEDEAFGMAGKTVGSFGRNVLFWLKPLLQKRGYVVKHVRNSDEGNYLDVTNRKGKNNRFYVFGGRDESSQDLVQGVTLAGFLFDEVALMPESFVNQATGRCSVEGSKLWFNCNPASPTHWFKERWLDLVGIKRMIHLHFTMHDNPSMSADKRSEYEYRYSGVFYKRFILGLWVAAEGAIYSMFDVFKNCYTEALSEHHFEKSVHYIAVDYGTQNATVFLHCVDHWNTVFIDDEYYHSGRDIDKYNGQKTDSEYADDLQQFMVGKQISFVIVDPSAASFKAELRKRGIRTKDAKNDVEDGIRLTASLLGRRVVQIAKSRCPNLVRELQSYVWDTKKTDQGKEAPLKKDDHAPDALRYFLMTVVTPKRKFK